MRFRSASRRHRPREAVVPMINVVFLLLIFFLMTASITPAPPFDLALPESGAGAEAETGDAIFLSAAGEIAFGGLRGDRALEAAAERDTPLEIRADRLTPGVDVARLLARLQALGVSETRLATERR